MAIARVQKVSAFTSTAGDLPVTINGVTAGNLLVVNCTYDTSNGFPTSTVHDDLSVNAVRAVAANASASQSAEIHYFKNYGTGGNRTITLHNSTAQSFEAIAVSELSGADTASTVLQGTASATGSTTTPASGNASPALTLNGAYGSGTNANATGTPATTGSGWTTVFNSTNGDGMSSEDQLIATAGAINAQWTSDGSGHWAAVVATFNPPATTPVKNPAVLSLNEARSALRRQDQIFQARSRGQPWFFSFKYTPIRALGQPLKFPIEIIEGRKKQQIHRKVHQHSFSSKYTPFPLIVKYYPTKIIVLNDRHLEIHRRLHTHTFNSKYTPFPPPPPPVTVPKIYNLFAFGRVLDPKHLILRSTETVYLDQPFPVAPSAILLNRHDTIILERAHLAKRWAHKRGPRSWHYIPPDIIPFLHWVPLEYEGIFLLKRAHDSHRWAHRRGPHFTFYYNHVVIPFVPPPGYDPAYFTVIKTQAHGGKLMWHKYKEIIPIIVNH